MKIAKPVWMNQDKKINIAVVGDLMLDQYVDTDVKRISPEAPVPVCNVSSVFYRAGGASNSALNIQLAGGCAHLFGFTGKDETRNILVGLLEEKKVDTKGVSCVDEFDTIKKIRLSSERQQIVRVDIEKKFDFTTSCRNELLTGIKKLSNINAILLSDYGKGTLDRDFIKSVISYAKGENTPVVIDPKGNDYTKYSGATVITPNRGEACLALNLKNDGSVSKERLAKELKERFDIEYVLLTLGQDGMYLYGGKLSEGIHLKAQAREVYDVSGAGDTVAAVLTLALGSGIDIIEAVTLSNIAAGVVVEKWGTTPITKDELLAAIDNYEGTSSYGVSVKSKIKDLEYLKAHIKTKDQRKKKVVFTNGCFDILHAGHVSYLEKASRLGDELVVAVNSDSSVKRLKGEQRPINSEENRAYLIAALGFVDYVVIFSEDTPKRVIDELVPDVLVKGSDWKVENIVGADTVIKNGGKVETIDLVEGLSTTSLIGKIKSK